MEEKRTVGIKIVAILITIISAFYSFMHLPNWKLNLTRFTFKIDITFFGLIYLIALIILTFAGVGLFFLKKWARITAIFAAFLLSVNILFVISCFLKGITLGVLVAVGFSADIMAPFVLYYLSRPKVKEQFK